MQRGITVTNTPGVLTEDTADMTMALILAVPRRLAEGAAVLERRTRWAGWSPTWMLGHRIWGKRLGIIGMGRIGQAVARRARAFGLQIHYHNRRRVAPQIEEELGATYWESLDQMLARMDIISVNCPHTPATYHLLSARRLKLMRPEAYVVNTARGEVIDENALMRLIADGEIAGAGLDVFEHEPAVNPKLVRLARAGKVVLLPHMGSATIEGRIDMGEKVIINIRDLPGRPQAAGPGAAVDAVTILHASGSLCFVRRLTRKSRWRIELRPCPVRFVYSAERIVRPALRIRCTHAGSRRISTREFQRCAVVGAAAALLLSTGALWPRRPGGSPPRISRRCSSTASHSPRRRPPTSSSRWCSRPTAP